MIINIRTNTSGKTRIWLYPTDVRVEWPEIPSDFASLPPHQALAALYDLPVVREHVDQVLAEGGSISIDIATSSKSPQAVDLDAFRLATGHTSQADAETLLREVFDRYPEYHDKNLGTGSFDDMVSLFAADDFYKLHHLAAELVNLRKAEDHQLNSSMSR